MIAKSLTAAIVSMSAAAGVVWVGTPTDETHPHRTEKPTAKEAIEHMLGTEGHTSKTDPKEKVAESRVVVSGEKDAPTRALPKSDVDSDADNRRWLDKYLSDETLDSDAPNSDQDTEMAEDDTSVEIRVRTKDGQTVIEKMSKEKGADGALKERKEKSVVNRELESTDIQRIVDALENGASMPEAMKLVSLEPKSRIELSSENEIAMAMPTNAMPASDDGEGLEKDLFGSTSLRTYTKAEPKKLLETTKLIDDDALRDQALFSILTYALRFDDFPAAKSALSRIDDDTLASNARARIAIRQAELGDIGAALKTIETIEDEELQDIIRVQMIETLTTPIEKRAER